MKQRSAQRNRLPTISLVASSAQIPMVGMMAACKMARRIGELIMASMPCSVSVLHAKASREDFVFGRTVTFASVSANKHHHFKPVKGREDQT